MASSKSSKPTRTGGRKAGTKRPTPPHLVEPKLKYVTDRTYQAYHAAVSRGFQEEDRPEIVEFDRGLLENGRTFGFTDGARWVSTCCAFSRSISVPGGADLPVAAVSVVTVSPPFRRRGLLTAMMKHQLEDVARRGEPLAALWATESLIYGRFGYAPAVSRARLNGENQRLQFLPGVQPTGSVDEVDREQFLSVARALHEAGRADRPGGLNRTDVWWDAYLFDFEFSRGGASELRYVLHYSDSGDVDGFAYYRFKEDSDETGPIGEVRINEVRADDPGAVAGLWRYLLDLDLARTFRMRNAPVDEPLRHLVTDARAVRTEITDSLYLRIVDLTAALRARRYLTEIDLVIEVADALLPANNGKFRLRAGTDHAEVTRSRSEPDLSLSILELGAVYLGGVRLTDLHRAGRVAEHTADAVAAASAAFGWHREPFCPDPF
ncbi:GNAT family N-acetyltransferase [Nakamurella lactea]|uniref:GNAT family N-acetyltransferase n=1 Tax=Nakamurella lactea TaxID=459515 RepID=UPI00068402F6|nr:GNAT family N-acetyltransferase [Nakamurella lactea]